MIVSLGLIVPTPGTPLRVTNNQAAPADRYAVHGLLIQARPTNIGRIYVGLVGMNKAALAGLLGLLAVPTSNVLPSFSIALTLAPNAINAADIYVDSDNVADGVIVSALIA